MWFVTAKKLDGLPLDQTDDDYSSIKMDVLRNVFFKYIDGPRPLIDEILQLHMYRGTMPTLIIIDYLHTFFESPVGDDIDFMQKHMLIAASLHSSVESLTKCLKWDCCSVLCVDTTTNPIYDRFMQIFVDSYFCRRADIFTSSGDLSEHLKAMPLPLEANARIVS